MNEDVGAGGIFDFPVGTDMIEMPMGVDNIFYFQCIIGQGTQDTVRISSRIDDDSFFGFRTSTNKTVRHQRTDRQFFNNQNILLLRNPLFYLFYKLDKAGDLRLRFRMNKLIEPFFGKRILQIRYNIK